METSPDYGKIAEESIKGRSRERRAAIEAEAKIHRVGLDAMGTKKVYEIDAETEKAVADIKRPAKRFAGIVGAAGEIAGGFVLKKFNDEAKERRCVGRSTLKNVCGLPRKRSVCLSQASGN